MTMIDEGILRDALFRAAAECEVSDLAKAAILGAAAVDEVTPRRRLVPDVIREPGRPRTLFAVAAVLVLVSAIAVPLFRGEALAPAKLSTTPTTVRGEASPVAPNSLSVGTALLPPAEAKTLTSTGFAAATTQKIESTGTVNLAVARGRVESTFAKLASLATQLHGLVTSTQANSRRTSGSFASGTIVLQVPEPSFARFVAEVERAGRATSVNTSSNNVTGQYVDLQARISALKASLAQYLRIMTKATTIGGILAVQNQIDTIQTEIEQDQGQLKVLANETTYASLTVNVTETRHHVATTRTGFGKAWHDSIRGFIAGFEWIVRLAGPALFAIIVLGALYEIVKYTRRAIRRRRI